MEESNTSETQELPSNLISIVGITLFVANLLLSYLTARKLLVGTELLFGFWLARAVFIPFIPTLLFSIFAHKKPITVKFKVFIIFVIIAILANLGSLVTNGSV